MECKRAHKLEESIKHSSLQLREEETEDKSSTANSDDDFVPILSKATKALKKQAIHKACTVEHYSFYVHWVYTARKLIVELSTLPRYIPEFILL